MITQYSEYVYAYGNAGIITCWGKNIEGAIQEEISYVSPTRRLYTKEVVKFEYDCVTPILGIDSLPHLQEVYKYVGKKKKLMDKVVLCDEERKYGLKVGLLYTAKRFLSLCGHNLDSLCKYKTSSEHEIKEFEFENVSIVVGSDNLKHCKDVYLIINDSKIDESIPLYYALGTKFEDVQKAMNDIELKVEKQGRTINITSTKYIHNGYNWGSTCKSVASELVFARGLEKQAPGAYEQMDWLIEELNKYAPQTKVKFV